MNEVSFIHKNKQRWDRFENLTGNPSGSGPDELYELYIQLTDDLAYARTYYPASKTTGYLNNLTQKVHAQIYRNKQVKKNRIAIFWAFEFPVLMFKNRKQLLYSFLVFFISVGIGIISTLYDVGFERIILGDRYVNMTLENINNNDPMAVYKNMNQVDMFLGISLNNIYVSFLAFVFGVLTPLGTGFILLKNGIMLGTFHTFLGLQGILHESITTIWIHGTFEIFAILVAGAAGFTIGNSILFPGTYSRIVSFRKGVLKGAKMVFGLIPFFLVAGFLEGFVTRHTEMPYSVKYTIISTSFLIILFYFFIYPYYLIKNNKYGK